MDKDLTLIEVEELLERMAAYQDQIKAAEAKRDTLVTHYQEKIQAAKTICDHETAQVRVEIALLTEQLRRYAANNLADGKKSIAFPTGKLSFRKQPTRFFFGDDMKEARSTDERLITFAKVSAPEFVKTTEYVAWDKLKPKLIVDGDNVYFAETGELIDGLRGQILPDKFTVQIS